MIELVGNGGHAAVIRDLIKLRERMDKTLRDDTGTIIAVGNNSDRKYEATRRVGTRWTYLIHPSATVASSALIGMGSVIMAGAIVQARASIGAHCIVNSSASVDHDCVLEDFVHIGPGAHLCGGVRVCEGALVGVGVGIEIGCTIPAWSIVKRQPYVIESIRDHATA